jgi:polysaccharide export outer membrane protein
MNLARLSILALFVPGMLCIAQESDSTAKPAAAAAEQATPAPVPAADAPAAASPDAASPALPTPAAAAPADSYIIGASDMLAVTVWKETSMSGSDLVRPDGMISLPLLGDVKAAGLTPLELSSQIAARLKKYIQDPNVSVVVVAIHSKIVYLLGEVGKKGPLEMTPGMTMLQAIASAGGLTDYANTKKIYILRDEDGKHQKIPVRYKDALKGDGSLDVVLKPGDTIVVP